MSFLDEHFLLESETAKILYHEYASRLPVIDYHCHLPPEQIAADFRFANLTQAWLAGDHYKWRAMRTNGVDESYCTGDRPDREKFMRWAETVPYTVRNPLFHWTHLELQRYFNCHELLNPGSADSIYQSCSAMLQTPAYSVRNLLIRMKVEVVCTTDDPVDDLRHHRRLREEGFPVKVLPAFRPDKAMAVSDAQAFNDYLDRLEDASGMSITHYQDYLDALRQRHDFFSANGCTVSDHGLEQIDFAAYDEAGLKWIFSRLRSGQAIEPAEVRQIRSALLDVFAEWDHEKGWVQQFHLGAMRNNNTRMKNRLGSDTGWDSIGDYAQAAALSGFLDRADSRNQLARTILYNLNPADNAVMATMAGNFNDGSIPGKIQFGAAWWFLDQKEGMISQMNTLSSMGLLSRFVGMLTDSRSFLSYPRHEYFRRLLCNLIGQDVEKGELPADTAWHGKIVSDICYHNAKKYFNW